MNRGDVVRLHPPRAWIAPAFVIERIGEYDAEVLRGVYFDPEALLAEVVRLAFHESNARVCYGSPWNVSISERDGLPCAIVQHPSDPDRVVIYHAVPA